ncbi:hypothetical protein U8335_23810 [Roseiconus lacunae]|uniref:hypothetical protein n=1 Tax=Roseiconus lacunae TaxID=2605694 RepID=UPI003085D5AE|nr:hypothetical protein U8335_23810 [Stieleria sp. HD01]
MQAQLNEMTLGATLRCYEVLSRDFGEGTKTVLLSLGLAYACYPAGRTGNAELDRTIHLVDTCGLVPVGRETAWQIVGELLQLAEDHDTTSAFLSGRAFYAVWGVTVDQFVKVVAIRHGEINKGSADAQEAQTTNSPGDNADPVCEADHPTQPTSEQPSDQNAATKPVVSPRGRRSSYATTADDGWVLGGLAAVAVVLALLIGFLCGVHAGMRDAAQSEVVTSRAETQSKPSPVGRTDRTTEENPSSTSHRAGQQPVIPAVQVEVSRVADSSPQQAGQSTLANSTPATVQRTPQAVRRLFLDRDGQHTVDAVAVSVTRETVELLRASDLKTIDVKIDRLSEPDQKWVNANRLAINRLGLPLLEQLLDPKFDRDAYLERLAKPKTR